MNPLNDLKSIIKENILQSKLLPNIIDPKIKAARQAIDSITIDDAKNEAAGILRYIFNIKQNNENEITLKRISMELDKLSQQDLNQKIIDYLKHSPTVFPISGFNKTLQQNQPFMSTKDIQQINSPKIQSFLINDPITQNIYSDKVIKHINQATLQNFFLK